MSNTDTKKCTKCNEIKELDKFHRDIKAKLGRHPRCRNCTKQDNAIRYANNKSERSKKSKKYYKKNKEKIKIQSNNRYQKNKEIYKISRQRYHERNRVLISKKNRTYRKNNLDRILRKEREYKKNNPGKVNALKAKRKADKRHQTPSWLTDEQLKQISDLYIECIRITKETGVKHHVDHIFPLRAVNEKGERVGSGLHVPWNLRIVEASQNCSDGAKLIEKS